MFKSGFGGFSLSRPFVSVRSDFRQCGKIKSADDRLIFLLIFNEFLNPDSRCSVLLFKIAIRGNPLKRLECIQPTCNICKDWGEKYIHTVLDIPFEVNSLTKYYD